MMKQLLVITVLLVTTACGSDSDPKSDVVMLNNGTENNGNNNGNNGTAGTNNGTVGTNNGQTTTRQTQSDCEPYETALDGVCERVDYINIGAYVNDDVRRDVLRKTTSVSACSVDVSKPYVDQNTYRFDDGICRVFFYDDIEENPQPIPPVPALDAGEITFETPGRDWVFEPTSETSCYKRVGEADGPDFVPGETIEVNALGGADFGAFSTTFQTPDYLTGVNFAPYVPNESLTVTWPVRSSATNSLSLTSISPDPDVGAIAVFCTSDNSGSFTIPQEAMAMLHDAPFRMTAGFTIYETEGSRVGNAVFRRTKSTSKTDELVSPPE